MTKEEAINKIRQTSLPKETMEILQALAPELRESEDERIRKRICLCLDECVHSDIIRDYERDEVLAYLEKQKEQKPAEWSEVELEFRGEKVKVKRPFFRDDKGREYSTTEQDDDVAWYALRAWCEKKGISMYDLYPREEWSEEDEKMLDEILDRVTYAFYNRGLDGEIEDDPVFLWLHKLRPSWKPSEEQMKALSKAIPVCMGVVGRDEVAPLESLCEQLKKL